MCLTPVSSTQRITVNFSISRATNIIEIEFKHIKITHTEEILFGFFLIAKKCFAYISNELGRLTGYSEKERMVD